MKTIEEQIAVMQHFANGGKVEVFDSGYESWEELESTDFNWGYRDYRIKEKKQTVTIEKWLCLDKADIKTNRFYILEATKEYLEKYVKDDEKIKLLDSYEVDTGSTEE